MRWLLHPAVCLCLFVAACGEDDAVEQSVESGGQAADSQGAPSDVDVDAVVAADADADVDVVAEADVDVDVEAKPTPMEKYVSEDAGFVLYRPAGWTARDDVRPGFRGVVVSDPDGLYEAAIYCGTSPRGNDLKALARYFAEEIGRKFPDLELREPMGTPEGKRIVFDGLYGHPEKGERELRCWLSLAGGDFSCSRIETPAGALEAERQMLLTILSNVRVIKGAFASAAPPVKTETLVPHRLRDGSATFSMPRGWRCQEFGKGSFVANDPSEAFSFMVGSADMITPQLGVNYPGAIISPYLPPSRAWKFLTEHLGIATGMQFEKVIPRQDINREASQVYTAGPVNVEEFIYTCNAQGRRCKGYTFGFSFGSRLGTNWNFRHLTVAAPAKEFDSYLVNFVAMLQSYKVDDQWAANYVAQGIHRLRQMAQQRTAEMVSRNAREIREMMQAAYDERQTSQDYIDYQRTNYIRGEQDWISELEGGTVYHTDTWGTQNMTTGEYWEGQPYDYIHFEGENPKYREDMDPIDSRELWEAHAR